jgi:hypothetical protein
MAKPAYGFRYQPNSAADFSIFTYSLEFLYPIFTINAHNLFTSKQGRPLDSQWLAEPKARSQMDYKEPQPLVGSQERSSQRAIRNRGVILAVLTVGGLCIASVLYAGRIMSDDPEAPTTPLDLSVPDQTATATFALG